MNPIRLASVSLGLLLSALVARPIAAQGNDVSRIPFEQAAVNLEKQLVESVEELAQLREAVTAEMVPLSRRLNELETALQDVRADFQQKTRLLDSRTLDLGNLRQEIKARQDESAYLGNLLREYVDNLTSRLHIAERQRYGDAVATAKLAMENAAAEQKDVFLAQSRLVSQSIDRLLEAGGGTRFQGHATDTTGLVNQGVFTLIGPLCYFRSADGKAVGTAEQGEDSRHPAVLGFDDEGLTASAAQALANTEGFLPMDVTIGNAHKVAAIDESLVEHIMKGGPVMYPILGLAALALLLALFKWIGLATVRQPSPKRIRLLLEAIARRDKADAQRIAEIMPGPTGEMLAAGVEHLEEPRELIEEVMYEKTLSAKLKLQRYLPFIAITASSAPLLGLLGTVTGIMKTFSLMTLFGTGDVKTLSSGISEALITTEFGLYVAIPTLLLHAFLSRKARGLVDGMEKAAVALINQVGKTPLRVERAPAHGPEGGSDGWNEKGPSRDQVKDLLAEMLAPIVERGLEGRARA